MYQHHITSHRVHLHLLVHLVVVALLWGNIPRLSAQLSTPVALISSPSAGAIGVQLHPSITVTTSSPIAPEFITYTFPDKDASTYNISPSILVVPKKVTQELSSSLWHTYAASGVFQLLNPTTLSFTPNQLTPATEYVVVVDGLKGSVAGAGPSPMTITFPKVMSSFTTVSEAHQVRATSLDGFNVINCGGEIIVYFNRDVQNPMTPLGPLMDAERIVSNNTGSGSQTVPMGGTPVLKYPNKRLVSLTVPGTIPGNYYYLNIHTSYLTGNPDDDRKLLFFVQNGYRVTIETQLLNSWSERGSWCR